MKVRFVHRWDSDCFSAPEGATGVVDEVSYNTRYEQHRINVKLDHYCVFTIPIYSNPHRMEMVEV